MSKIDKAKRTIINIDELAGRDQWMNRIHPLVKLLFVILYLIYTMGRNAYDINRIVLLSIIPLFLFVMADLSVRDAAKRLRVVIPILLLMGIANVFFDAAPFLIGSFVVRAGVISMITTMLKGFYAVIITYVFVATTSIEKLCVALRMIYVPKIIVNQIMLTYRYIGVLLTESDNVTTAYMLRAPGQKGVHFKVWGSLAGQMLLRSFDRAEQIYESMKLRGYE